MAAEEVQAFVEGGEMEFHVMRGRIACGKRKRRRALGLWRVCDFLWRVGLLGIVNVVETEEVYTMC